MDDVQISNYFGGEPSGRTWVEVRVGKLRNRKASGKDDVTGEILKGGGYMVLDWILRLCNMAFKSVVMNED